MKLNIANLSDGIHDYVLSAEASDLGLAENFVAKVKTYLKLEKSNRQLLLKANLRTEAKFQCDRCLEEFTQRLENSYQMFYVYREIESVKHEHDDVRVIAPETSSIDLSDDVRQFLLLAVPLKLLCRAECRGLCPHCGANLNHDRCTCTNGGVDPTWDTLKTLRKN